MIAEIRVENFKKIKAVRIRPSGSSVIVGGRNAQGKSSILDAIQAAICGARSIPEEPIRRGASRGEVEIDLDDGIRVVRTFSLAGGSSLRIQAADGSAIRSPQTWLDERISSLSFDPIEFLRLRPQEQAQTLRRIAGIDTADLDRRRADAFSERTELNRRVRDADARLRGMPSYPDAPARPLTTEGLTEELAQARRANEAKAAAGAAASAAAARASAAAEAVGRYGLEASQIRRGAERRVETITAEIGRLEASLAAARAALSEAAEELDRVDASVAARRIEILDEADDAAAEAARAAAEADALPYADDSSILARFGEIEAINASVRANVARAEAEAELGRLSAASRALGDEIDRIDQAKTSALAAARFPVPGLGFDADGLITLDGIPLLQASGAQRIRLSMAIALSQHPGLPIVLIRDGSALDDDSLRLVDGMAEAAGALVLIERVVYGQQAVAEGAIVICDGEIAEEEVAGA